MNEYIAVHSVNACIDVPSNARIDVPIDVVKYRTGSSEEKSRKRVKTLSPERRVHACQRPDW